MTLTVNIYMYNPNRQPWAAPSALSDPADASARRLCPPPLRLALQDPVF